MNDERPLSIAELADVDSPEIVAKALKRFRQRVFFRALWTVCGLLLIVGLIVSYQRMTAEWVHVQYARTLDGYVVGAALQADGSRAILVDAKRLDPPGPARLREGRTYGLRFVLETDQRVEADEELLLRPTSLEPGDDRSWHFSISSVPPAFGKQAAETLLFLQTGVQRVELEIIARATARPLDDDANTQPWRVLATVTLDVEELRIPERIWRGDA